MRNMESRKAYAVAYREAHRESAREYNRAHRAAKKEKAKERGAAMEPKLCECGCGEAVPIAAANRKEYGHVEGEPIRFIHNHHPRRTMQELLYRNIDISGECFIWTGTEINGYGRLGYKGRDMLAHRASYIFFRGEIPDGMFVCHECDNPACVRPDHLFLGTAKDNAEDCFKKNRTAHGEKNHHHKITAETAAEIFEACRAGNMTQGMIAEKYNTSRAVVTQIKIGRNWRRATGASA